MRCSGQRRRQGSHVPPATVDDGELWDQIRPRLASKGPGADWSDLLDDEQSGRIRSLLVQHLNDINGQLASRNAALDALHEECLSEGSAGKARYFAAKDEHDQWRRSAIHFKRVLENRVAEAKRAHDVWRREEHATRSTRTVRAERESLRILAVAISEHQRACSDAGLEPTKADIALWGTLDELDVEIGGGRATLAQMVNTAWHD